MKQRFFISLAATLAMTAVGMIFGWFMARQIALVVSENTLDQYANRLMADGEASMSELRTVLVALNASQSSPCSEQENRYFQALIFESEYLKDAGRMSDGLIQCSAAMGKLAKPIAIGRPDSTQPDGTIFYKNPGGYRNSDLVVLGLQLGDSYVVFTPLTRLHLEPAPLHFAETLTDAPTQRPVHLLGEPVKAATTTLTSEGLARVGESIFATRCSIRFFNCVTAYSSTTEIVEANRARFYGCILLCGVAGGAFGLAVSLLYRRNKSMEQQLRRAIRADKLRVVYQPIVELEGGRIVGAEALVRWNDEDDRPVGPDVFIKIAEERGFVGEITRLVVDHVLHDFARVLRDQPEFRLSINVAAADLSDAAFLPMLDAALKRAGVPTRSLVIEITEGSTARHKTAIETIRSLRERGHSVHIDDFGTGYSSLAYLHDLSVNAIKIDKAFTQAIGTEAVTVNILPQIMQMANALHLTVVVEGIETEEQARYFGCINQPVFGQGWLFGRPVPVEEFQKLLVEHEVAELVTA